MNIKNLEKLKKIAKFILPRKFIYPVGNFVVSLRFIYFRLYRKFFKPNKSYIAVCEKNNITLFPPEWTSVNLENSDIIINLEENDLILENIQYAYSAHTIEHLSNSTVKRLFSSIYSSMKKGGVIRIECPDLDMLLNDYKCINNNGRVLTKRMLDEVRSWNMPKVDGLYEQEHIMILAAIVSYFDKKYNMPLPPLCSLEEFNDKMRTLNNAEFGDWAVSLLTPEQLSNSFEHRNWFNFNKLRRMLEGAGFSEVTKCDSEETHHGFRMNIARKHRDWYSIYVEAIKK
jgi:hypothetical protein